MLYYKLAVSHCVHRDWLSIPKTNKTHIVCTRNTNRIETKSQFHDECWRCGDVNMYSCGLWAQQFRTVCQVGELSLILIEATMIFFFSPIWIRFSCADLRKNSHKITNPCHIWKWCKPKSENWLLKRVAE